MNTAPSGSPLAFEVSFDRDDLYVGMSVYELGVTNTLVQLSLMEHVVNGTYVGYFTPQANKKYLVIKTSYEDMALTTIDLDRSPASETLNVVDQDLSTSLTSQDLLDIAAAVWGQPVLGNTANGTFGRLLSDTKESADAAATGGGASQEIIGAIYATVLEEAVVGVVSE